MTRRPLHLLRSCGLMMAKWSIINLLMRSTNNVAVNCKCATTLQMGLYHGVQYNASLLKNRQLFSGGSTFHFFSFVLLFFSKLAPYGE